MILRLVKLLEEDNFIEYEGDKYRIAEKRKKGYLKGKRLIELTLINQGQRVEAKDFKIIRNFISSDYIQLLEG